MAACLPSPAVRRGGRLRDRKAGLLEHGYLFRLQTFGASRHNKLHSLTLIEGAVAFRLDGGKMDKNVFAGLALDETVALRSVEPLHSALFFHRNSSTLR